MRVLVCGSRDYDYDNWRPVYETLFDLWFGNEELTIIQGGCSGADALGKKFAEDTRCGIEEYPADWNKHGKAAGPIRNASMLATGVDKVIAFINKPLEESRGTLDMVKKARDAGVEVQIVSN